MKLYHNADKADFAQLCRFVERYAVWEPPERIRKMLLVTRKMKGPRSQWTGQRESTGRAAEAVDAMLSGRHFLVLEPPVTQIRPVERLLDRMRIEAVEVFISREGRAESYEPVTVLAGARFFVMFDTQKCNFHRVRPKGKDFDIYSTWNTCGYYIPPTYSFARVETVEDKEAKEKASIKKKEQKREKEEREKRSRRKQKKHPVRAA